MKRPISNRNRFALTSMVCVRVSPYASEWKRHEPSRGCGTTVPRETLGALPRSRLVHFRIKASGCDSRSLSKNRHECVAWFPSHLSHRSNILFRSGVSSFPIYTDPLGSSYKHRPRLPTTNLGEHYFGKPKPNIRLEFRNPTGVKSGMSSIWLANAMRIRRHGAPPCRTHSTGGKDGGDGVPTWTKTRCSAPVPVGSIQNSSQELNIPEQEPAFWYSLVRTSKKLVLRSNPIFTM